MSSHKKYVSDWRELSTKQSSSKKCSAITDQDHCHLDSSTHNNRETYIDFGASTICYEEKKPNVLNHTNYNTGSNNSQTSQNVGQFSSGMATATHPSSIDSFTSSFPYADIENQDLFDENWEEIRSVVQLALNPTFF